MLFREILFVACILCLLPQNPVQAIISVPTDTLQWTLSNRNGSISVPGTVPGGVYTDLLNGSVLNNGDFYYRYNDLEYRWVSYDDWMYTTTVDLPESLADSERIAFSFDGIDTVAEIFLDGNLIATTNNMFSNLLLDVKQYVDIPSTVELSIILQSPVQYSKNIFDSYLDTNGYKVLPECVDSAYKGECHANTIRKMQASFSWDWGPAFPNLGIWKPWQILGWSSLKITNLYFESVPITTLPETPDFELMASWIVYYKVYIDLASSTDEVTGTLTVSLDGTEYVNTEIIISPGDFPDLIGRYENFFVVPEDTVETWWPNGYGSQPLYDFTATFTPRALPDSDDSSKSVNVGFRTAEFDESFVDVADPTKGRYYRAKINNVYMFMMGSNWIPAHILPEQVDPQYTRLLLTAAKNTHQNCIRVWGGGIYETDEFYQIADELGILIWQDLMFACSMYPADEAFLTITAKEMRYQVQRTQYHPSILLWATNNENEAALKGNWYGTESNFDQYKADYVTLYVDTLATIVKEEDPSRKVIISSPSNGLASEEVGYIADNPYDNHYGDNHYYNYLANAWSYNHYPATRFASEYGFQSFPSYQTLLPVFDEEDMQIDSPMMEHRQHHPNGQSELNAQLNQHFNYDASMATFQEYLYLVQVHQAMAIKTETEYYRRMRSTLNEDGTGLTMGALYWQLNDIWQGASWASLEYGGRWKILHNYAQNFFAPLIAVPWIEDGMLKVTVVNDNPGDLSLASVVISIERISGMLPSVPFVFEITDTIASQSAVLVLNLDLEADLSVTDNCPASTVTNEPYDNCLITVDLLTSLDSQFPPQNFVLLGEPKNSVLPAVNFNVTVEPITEADFLIEISADDVAMFVFLESPYPGVFSDNGFILPYERKKTLTFNGSQFVNVNDFESTLNVTNVVG